MIQNKVFSSLFILFCPLLFWAQAPGYQYHQVAAGETRYGISRQYEISLSTLDSLNPVIQERGLRPGMSILVPKKGVQTSPAPENKDSLNYHYHRVAAGETIFSLLRQYQVSRAEFDSLNPEFKTMTLRVGDIWRFPKKPKAAPEKPKRGYLFHEVQAGETAFSLAKEYEISLDSLYRLNPEARQGLAIGQKLKLPGDTAVLIPGQAEKEALNQDIGPREQNPKASGDEDYFLYKVKPGDTFYSLSKRYNVPKEELLKFNPELEVGLKVGRYIIIPKIKDPEELGWLDRLFNKVEEPPSAKQSLPAEAEAQKRQLNEDSSSEIAQNLALDSLSLEGDSLVYQRDKEFRIAVILPFMTQSLPSPEASPEEAIKWQPSGNSEMAIQFYHGWRLAADSLRKRGMKLHFSLYDSKASLEKVKKIVPRLEMEQPDLVVGPAYRKNVEYLSAALAPLEIPVLSPLSRAVSSAGSANLIQMVAAEERKNQKIADLINRYHDSARVIFAHCGSADALASVQEISARLRPREESYIEKMVSCESFKSRSEFREQLNFAGPKVVVFLSEDPVFLSDLTAKLSSLDDTNIFLVGSPKLLDLPTIELDYLEKLHFTTYEVRHANFDHPMTRAFVRKFRAEFVAEPSPFALQGYDAGLFFLEQLWDHGPFFLESLSGIQLIAQATGFDLQRNDQGGIENHFLFLTGVRKFQLVRLD